MVRREREDIILLSIDPEFANAIFDGSKKHEFRKSNLPSDLTYVVLVENGTRSIPGGFLAGEVHEEEIDDLWNKFGSGVSDHGRFTDYYDGWDTGLAITVEEPDPFDGDLHLDSLTSADVNLQVPEQFSFVYLTQRSLQILSQYSDTIDDVSPLTRLDNWSTPDKETPELDFRPMKEQEEGHFRELFLDSPVPTQYQEIDDSFIDHILDTHYDRDDQFGYFTDKKIVYTFLKESQPIGYTVTTWKIGNSVKYGPTVLEEDNRGLGYGPQLRRMIDNHLRSQGVRKVYSTIPESQTRAYRYLIKSGYTVEAHMRDQYHEDHGELVFGKLLGGAAPSEIEYPDRIAKQSLDFCIGSAASDDLTTFVVNGMEQWYDNIDSAFVESVLEAEGRDLEEDLSKKGKRIYIGHHNGDTQCAVIASLKRGRGVKISPFLTKICGDELSSFLDYVEGNLLNELEAIRKFYTHVPALDPNLIEFFYSNGYDTEGLLKQPYKDGIDMVFLGKLVK